MRARRRRRARTRSKFSLAAGGCLTTARLFDALCRRALGRASSHRLASPPPPTREGRGGHPHPTSGGGPALAAAPLAEEAARRTRRARLRTRAVRGCADASPRALFLRSSSSRSLTRARPMPRLARLSSLPFFIAWPPPVRPLVCPLQEGRSLTRSYPVYSIYVSRQSTPNPVF